MFKGERIHRPSTSESEWVHLRVPAIVTEEEWAAANRVLKGHNLTALSHAKIQYILNGGRIGCALCGRSYIGAGTHYRCSGRHIARQLFRERGQRCMAPSVHRLSLEGVIWDDILAYLSKPGMVLKQLKAKLAQAETEDHTGQERTHLVKQRERLMEQDQNLATLVVKRVLTDADFLRERMRIQAERDSLDRLLADLDRHVTETESNRVRLKSVEHLLRDLRTQVETLMPLEKRRDLVDLLVGRITIQADGSIDIQYQFEQYKNRFRKISETANVDAVRLYQR